MIVLWSTSRSTAAPVMALVQKMFSQGRLKVSHKADCGALRGLLFLVGLLLSLVQARVAF